MAVKTPYSIAWTRTATSDGSNKHIFIVSVTDNTSALIETVQLIFNATDPERLVAQRMRGAVISAMAKNAAVQDMPASGSFTANVQDLASDLPL